MILAAAPLKPGASLDEIKTALAGQPVPLHRLSGDLPLGRGRAETPSQEVEPCRPR